MGCRSMLWQHVARLLASTCAITASLFVLVAEPPSANAQSVINPDPFALLRQTTDGTGNQQTTQEGNNQALLLNEANQADAIEIIQQEAIETNRVPVQRSNIQIGAVEPGGEENAGEDPYAPSGTQIGSLRLTSFFKQSLGYSTNQQSEADGDGGAFSFSEVDFQLRSQWSRHQLEVNANGTYKKYFDGALEPVPAFDIDGSLRLDLIDGVAATIGGSYNFENEEASSTSLSDTTINRPGVDRFGAYARLQRSGRRFDLMLRASIDRSLYQDAKLSGGATMSQRDRDLVNYGLRARIGYQTGLAISPFIEASYNIRDYDLAIDRNGQNRDSQVLGLRGGFSLDIGEKINGEFSLGYINEELSDPAIAALTGVIIDADINWSPQRDTNIALTLESNLGGSTTAGDSGAITHDGSLSYRRRIRDNLEIGGMLSLGFTNYENLDRTDITYSAELDFEHWINRNMSLTGEFRYTNRDSTSPDNSYDKMVFLLGVKVQR